jgi:hypothetical protein
VEGDGPRTIIPALLRPEDLERFRRMKPEERLKIGLDLTDAAWRFLLRLPPAEVQRRLDLGREPWNVPERPAKKA